MAGVSYRITWNEQEFRAISSPNGYVGIAVRRASGKVRDRAKQNITAAGRVDTGKLRQSIRVERATASRPGFVRYQVGSDLLYAIYQEEGTQGPIVPRRARVLRFQPKGSSTFVFRPRVSGVEGIHYLTRALATLRLSDFYP